MNSIIKELTAILKGLNSSAIPRVGKLMPYLEYDEETGTWFFSVVDVVQA